MTIENLLTAKLRPYGEILTAFPGGNAEKTHLRLLPDTPVEEYFADTPVTLDYVSGMSLLVLRTSDGERVFYLDRVVTLRAGVPFSVLALDGACEVDLCTEGEGSLRLLRTYAPDTVTRPCGDLGFRRMYLFFYQECAADFYFRGERHEAYEMVYVDRGRLHNLVGGKDIPLSAEQLLLIDRNVWHTQYADLPVSFLTLSFRADGERLAPLCGRAVTASAHETELLRRMLRAYGAGEYAREETESLFRLLLISLLKRADSKKEPRDRHLPATDHADRRLADRLLRTVSEHCAENLTTASLAASAHISTTYLHRLFRATLGMTPGAYIAKIRMEECKLLLRDGTLTMGEIARKMGFSSQQHFSRRFRTVTGMTPSEYVRSLR